VHVYILHLSSILAATCCATLCECCWVSGWHDYDLCLYIIMFMFEAAQAARQLRDNSGRQLRDNSAESVGHVARWLDGMVTYHNHHACWIILE
jgi:hypothetical protein